MTFKISLPISHLFEKEENISQLSGKYDCLETRPFTLNCSLPDQQLFHADNIQPIHELADSDFKFLEEIREKKKDLKAISFHCASCCLEPEVKDGIFYKGKNRSYARDEMYKNAERNLSIIKSIFPDTTSISIENNNYYPTDAYMHVTEAQFIRDIVYDNDICFLFDNAHARVTAFNSKISYDSYIKNLPLDKMNQIQFCEAFVPETGLARDIHELPTDKTVEEIVTLAREYDVQYVTPEYYKSIERLIKLLESLNNAVI